MFSKLLRSSMFHLNKHTLLVFQDLFINSFARKNLGCMSNEFLTMVSGSKKSLPKNQRSKSGPELLIGLHEAAGVLPTSAKSRFHIWNFLRNISGLKMHPRRIKIGRLPVATACMIDRYKYLFI